MNSSRAISKAMGAGFGGSDSRALLASNHRAAEEARRQARIGQTVQWILADCIADVTEPTPDAPGVIEFTPPFSRIVPFVVVTGRIVGGRVEATAEAGPGQTVSEETLAAFLAATPLVLAARKAAREAN